MNLYSSYFEYCEKLDVFRILRIMLLGFIATLQMNRAIKHFKNKQTEMTKMLSVQSLPSAEEIALAKLSSQELSAVLEANGDVQNFNVVGKDGENHSVKLPASAVKLMIEVLTQLGQGNSVSITPIHAELTTQEAADMLNMSRPTFIKLLDSGELAHTRTGNRRKVAFVDVMKFKQEIDAKRMATLDELSALDQELDLGY